MCKLNVEVIPQSLGKSVSDVRRKLNVCEIENRSLSGFLTDKVVRDRDCLVYCEAGWPEAVNGIGWLEAGRRIYLYSADDALTEIADMLPGKVEVLGRSEAIALIERDKIISLIIGSLLFVSDVLNDRNQFPILNSIVAIPYNRFRKKELVSAGLRWRKVTHAMLGGITTTAWSIGVPARMSTVNMELLSPSFGLERYLKHGFKDGELGRVIPPPSSSLMDKRLSIISLTKEHAFPCYRSCTGWVWRTLTSFEIGLILDLNELLLNKICRKSPDDVSIRNFILRSVPGKVSQLLHAAIKELWSNETLFSTDRANVNAKLLTNVDDAVLNEASGGRSMGRLLLKNDSDIVNRKANVSSYLLKEAEYLLDYGQKAAKSDDSSIPVELWDRSILRGYFEWLPYDDSVAHALSVLRNKLGMRIYLINLVKSFFRYIQKTYGNEWITMAFKTHSGGLTDWSVERRKEIRLDLSVGLDSLNRAIRSSWWEWLDGSTCYFWRWPVEVRRCVRDGFPVWVESKLPEYKRCQTFKGLNVDQMQALEKKVHKVINRRYLNKGFVKSLINYFAVPKGLNDIRIVYDGTKSGLTDAVWVPNFYMPSIDSLLLYCSPKTWFSDMDLGEMFLNYFMDPKIRPFCGVDVSHFVDKESNEKSLSRWLQWNRIFMGFRSSPYYAVRTFSYCVDLVRGNWTDATNPYSYSRIRLNLPGSKEYSPSLPWISKMQGDQESGDIVTYMDDGRPYGGGERICRKGAKKASKVTQYLGQQDAARKYRPPSQQPGPWCGAFIAEKDGSVWAYVSDEKWLKAQSYLKRWLFDIAECIRLNTPPVLDFKDLERGRGFLVYLSRTYPSIVPYLKGIHLSIDCWRPNRDKDGWKKKPTKKRFSMSDEQEVGEFYTHDVDDIPNDLLLDKDGNLLQNQNDYENHPEKVSLAPRLFDDLHALEKFFEADKPCWRFVRGKEIMVAEYGFGDASGAGYGSTYATKKGIQYRFGTWGTDLGGESSNFRELKNLVDSLYARVEEDVSEVKGLEVFLFTDNLVAEGAFYKGTSTSRKLFELVLRLRLLEMKAGFKIHIIHIAGTRMISQGTDGLSRGDCNEGVMKGMSMLDYVPLDATCLKRSPLLKEKIKSCIDPYLKATHLEARFLTEFDWFNLGHDIVGGSLNDENIWVPEYKSGFNIWCPAPAAGQHAIEQLRLARLKKTTSVHLFIIPRIFTSLWRKQIYRCADLVFDMPFDSCLWTQELQHEPLTVAFLFPFLTFKPWQLRRSFSFLGMGRVLRRLWEKGDISKWDLLCKFCAWSGRIASMPPDVVRKMLQSSRSFELFCGKTRE